MDLQGAGKGKVIKTHFKIFSKNTDIISKISLFRRKQHIVTPPNPEFYGDSVIFPCIGCLLHLCHHLTDSSWLTVFSKSTVLNTHRACVPHMLLLLHWTGWVTGARL